MLALIGHVLGLKLLNRVASFLLFVCWSNEYSNYMLLDVKVFLCVCCWL